ncbi:hypothetical protein T552_03026 [Pneumocystis carinii B80]|uniref:Uncharacterized protein n=1 Tax=Pneumocystis carinii (strain B80) TaxID=1408658 RepID=A0A0W4ZCI4_PNEC8|nr:hypothetical protein T552_03026 [Pneumocystis carinii B80]KTW26132.1 hypothetical protein T552_03026 [Pneumocystis carinii B80]
MYCLCHFLPFLFIPTGGSAYFHVIFVVSLLLFHRPCIYCSFILITLFGMMCYWREECYFDFNGGRIFEPRVFGGIGGNEGGRWREWRQPLVKVTIRF